MQAWVKRILSELVKSPDAIAMSVGLLGLALLVVGLGLVYMPLALVVGGVVLMCWSYLAARAIAAHAPGGIR